MCGFQPICELNEINECILENTPPYFIDTDKNEVIHIVLQENRDDHYLLPTFTDDENDKVDI